MYFGTNKTEQKDLITCSLNKLEGRIQAFNIGRNIGRLLPLLRQNIPESFQEEFDVLYQTRTSKVIQLKHDSVIKYYSTPDFVLNIVELYREMAEHAVPYIDSVLQHNVTERTIPYIIFTPRGVLYNPRTINQLIKTIYCVLTVLSLNQSGNLTS